jgi:hypothetical protein
MRAMIHDAVVYVRENAEKLRECRRHHFADVPPALGERWRCTECGGTLQITEVMSYCAGYVAAGGYAGVIWSGYQKRIGGA